MDIEKVKETLKKYGITSDEELNDALYIVYNAKTELEPYDKKYCMKSNNFSYNQDLPECRKVFEIYRKFYKKHFKKYKFAEYWKSKCSEGPSLATYKRYLSCKMCECIYITSGVSSDDGQYELKNHQITSSEVKHTLCKSLDVKLDDKLFDNKYLSVKIFVEALIPVTAETFQPKKETNKINHNGKEMTKKEREKLFNIVYVTKEELKNNLDKNDTFEGSDIYLLNLALYAFERGLNEHSLGIVNKLQEKGTFQDDIDFLQLQAKLLSNIGVNEEAISVLKNIISLEEPMINPESYNLLAASTKRKAFEEYSNHKLTDEEFINNVKKAKELYAAVYAISKNYYPAINIIYLEKLLRTGKDEVLQKIWEQSDIQSVLNKEEWWSQISDIEYNILMGKEETVQKKLTQLEDNINSGKFDVTDFNIFSTIRQLKFMIDFTADQRYNSAIQQLEAFQKKLENVKIKPL